jgi:hypothetical protein
MHAAECRELSQTFSAGAAALLRKFSGVIVHLFQFLRSSPFLLNIPFL